MSLAARSGAQSWCNRRRPAVAAVGATGGGKGDAGIGSAGSTTPTTATARPPGWRCLPLSRGQWRCCVPPGPGAAPAMAMVGVGMPEMAMIGVVRLQSMKPASMYLASRVSTEHAGVCGRVSYLLRVCGVRPRPAAAGAVGPPTKP